MMARQAIATAALLVGGGAFAQVAGPAAPQVYRLSPEEVLRLQMATADRTDTIDTQFLRPRDGRVHGEVGVGIGTGGYRSVYGAMAVPLGDNASASFAFESSRFDDSLLYGNRLRGGRVPYR